MLFCVTCKSGRKVPPSPARSRQKRLCVNLTWAKVDVKSWHSRSAHRAENTSMAPARPQSPDDVRKMIEIPRSRSRSLGPRVRNSALLHAAECLPPRFQMKPSLQAKGAELKTGEASAGARGVRWNEPASQAEISDMEKMGRANLQTRKRGERLTNQSPTSARLYLLIK